MSTRHWLATNARSPLYLDSNCFLFDGDAAARDGIAVEAALNTVIEHLSGSPAGFAFYVTPCSTPADLGERLVRDHGLVPEGAYTVMAVPVSELAEAPVPEGYEIREVLSAEDYVAYVRALCEGFDLVPIGDVDALIEHFLANIGLRHYPALRQFTAWHDGRVVATSASWTYAGISGVYCVSTLAAHRGRGLGAAMTRHAALSGKPLTGVAFLQATVMGAPVYRRLGFQDVGFYYEYIRGGPGGHSGSASVSGQGSADAGGAGVA